MGRKMRPVDMEESVGQCSRVINFMGVTLRIVAL